jgi:ribosome recycling factor
MDRLIARAKADMEKTVEVVRHDIAMYRTGRASPALVEDLEVEVYGTKMPVNQLASIQVLDTRLLGIQPWDKSTLTAIEKAIMTSELGLMPASDGNMIRLEIPTLTEERREELTKQVRKRLEEGRVAIRNIRRATNEAIEKMEKSEGLSEDEVRVGKKEVQDLTDEHIRMIDEIGEAKIREIMEI